MVVVAAGLGHRLDAARPKALVEVRGRPLIDHALERVSDARVVDELVVVYTPGHEQAFRAACAAHRVDRFVAGGDTRTASTRAGLAATSGAHRVLAVHDAARAFVDPGTIAAVVQAIRDGAIAAAPGHPVPDTLKEAEPDTALTGGDGGARVVGTRSRERLWAVQTPQAFLRDVLDRALDLVGELAASDDLALVERARDAGAVEGEIRLVAASWRGFKVTYRPDLDLADLVARAYDGG